LHPSAAAAAASGSCGAVAEPGDGMRRHESWYAEAAHYMDCTMSDGVVSHGGGGARGALAPTATGSCTGN
jgi:hypothetical protein